MGTRSQNKQSSKDHGCIHRNDMILEDKTQRIIVIGDSKLVIKGLRGINHNPKSNLQRIYKRIKIKERKFGSVEYYHILHHQNQEVDQLAKESKSLNQGDLKDNEVITMCYLPWQHG
jgi:ribonuclease HI